MDARLLADFATAEPNRGPDVAPEDLVRLNSKLVERIARRVYRDTSSSIAIEDLIQIGQIALIEAANTFVDRGTAMFTTYANLRVRGAMIDELRKSATISREAMRRRRQFAKARQDLSTRLGRSPDESEMAAHVDLGLGAYRAAIDSMQAIEYTSIDDVYVDTSSWFADRTPGADELLELDRRRTAIAKAVAKLPEREQTILQMFFVDECSLDEISRIFNVSATRICQIKRAALQGLRGDLSQWQDD